MHLGADPVIPDPNPDFIPFIVDDDVNAALNVNPPLQNDNRATVNNSNLSFSIQNVRSMNISTKNDITLQKILAICSTKSDFIFLSDLRLNSTRQNASLLELEKMFFFHGYKLIHNSTLPSRGVGILIKRGIFDNDLEILNTVRTVDCNCLTLHVRVFNKEYVFVLSTVRIMTLNCTFIRT